MQTDARPVFVVGCAESGTSVLAGILGAHSRAVAVPDSAFITEAIAASPDARIRLAGIVRHDGLRAFGLDRGAAARELSGFGADYAAMWLHLVRRHAEAAGRPAPRVWIDATPVHGRTAATLVELFPRARFVHVVRDGRAVAAALLASRGRPKTVRGAAKAWVQSLAFGLGLELWGGPRVMRVRYEDVLANPYRTVPAVSAFAGLEYEPAMLRADGPGATDVTHAWEESLTLRQIEIFEATAGDLLRYLGYPMRFAGQARPATVRERIFAALAAAWPAYRRAPEPGGRRTTLDPAASK